MTEILTIKFVNKHSDGEVVTTMTRDSWDVFGNELCDTYDFEILESNIIGGQNE